MQRSPKNVGKAIAEIQRLRRPDLLARWRAAFGRPAPAKISRELLVRALAYDVQAKVFGGLAPATKAKLIRLAAEIRERGDAAITTGPRIKPGTRLIREWRGDTHEVTVLERSFAYRVRTYDSLSEIARVITGTRWSGPLFFGLKRPEPADEG
jgi:hypothetical protein